MELDALKSLTPSVCMTAWYMELCGGRSARGGYRGKLGGVSVNSPPCIKNRHARAALCAVLTSPTKPPLTFPHCLGGCGSQRWLFLHFIQVRSDLLSLVKHWRSWPRWPPLAASQCQNNTSSSAEGLRCSACCYKIMLPSFGFLHIYTLINCQIKTKCRLNLMSVFLHIKLLKEEFAPQRISSGCVYVLGSRSLIQNLDTDYVLA